MVVNIYCKLKGNYQKRKKRRSKINVIREEIKMEPHKMFYLYQRRQKKSGRHNKEGGEGGGGGEEVHPMMTVAKAINRKQ